MNAERIAAFAALLAKPDPKDLRPRGYVLTQPGKRERWEETWVPAVQVWTALRLAESVGAEDGWKPGAAFVVAATFSHADRRIDGA